MSEEPRIRSQKLHCRCFVYLDALLKKLQKVAEIAYMSSKYKNIIYAWEAEDENMQRTRAIATPAVLSECCFHPITDSESVLVYFDNPFGFVGMITNLNV